jgi:plastocyanin
VNYLKPPALIAIGLALLGFVSLSAAAEVQIRAQGPDRQPLAGLVLWLQPQNDTSSAATAPAIPAMPWVMDQVDMQFEPEVLVVPVNARVSFPNSDKVAHQVYSFSPAKRFSLGLYRGKHYPPVDFSKPGLVVLGCNIHDAMVGYIYVVESPYSGKSDEAGVVQLSGVPAGNYLVKAWSPRFKGEDAETLSSITVKANDVQVHTFAVSSSLRPVQPKLVHPKGLHY